MITKRGFLIGAGTSLAAGLAPSAQAQAWPDQPIRVLLGTAAGGAPDIVGRMLAEKLSSQLRQSVIIENMAQGGGVVSTNTVAKSKPDGSVFAMLTGGFVTQAAVRKSLPYDSVADFTFISMLCAYPMLLGVRPDSEIASFPDLLERAKKEPGKISYTITFPGSTHHLFGTWFNMQAGTQMLAVPYKGAGPGFVDVAAGRVDVMLEPSTTGIPRVRNGQLRLLAVSSPERYPLLPDVPTIAETLPGVETMTWLGIAAVSNTPSAIVDRLNAELRGALELPDVKKRLADVGTIAMPSTPAEFRERVEREIARWKHIVEVNKIPLI